MLAWIFDSEEYTQLYHQYFDQFISEYFESGYFAQVMDQVYALIAPYVEKDPTKFCTYEEFETGFATLEQFCLLRAESIRGQLEGTIPSTDEGQAQDSSTLIDASAITISDMGSMNNGGKDGFSPEDGMERPSRTQGDTVWQESSTPQEDAATQESSLSQESTVSPELPSVPSNSSQAERPQASTPAQSGTESGVQPGQSAGFDRQGSRMTGDISAAVPGDRTGAAPSDGQDSGQWLLLAASGGVLLVGLLIAILYKKRC